VRYEHHAPASLFTANNKCTPHHEEVTHRGHLLLGDPGNRVYIDADHNILSADREDNPSVSELLEHRQTKIDHINANLLRPKPPP
jgi:hypothetical protein